MVLNKIQINPSFNKLNLHPQQRYMHIVVIAGGETQHQFNERPMPSLTEVKFITSLNDRGADTAHAYFYLLDEIQLRNDAAVLEGLTVPVFIHAVTTILQHLPSNAIRISAWPGFLSGQSLEIACAVKSLQKASTILDALSWSFNVVPDIVGFISPRVIAMIVNEAYFALEEKVSTKGDIDIAMRLGTNYPYGPFEWSEMIGLKNIASLLQQLAITDKRYTPAPLLLKEIK